MSNTFEEYLSDCKTRTNKALEALLGSDHSPFSDTDCAPHLHTLKAAMAYSQLNGGKRVRPMLVFAAAQAMTNGNNDNNDNLDKIACAIEMIHTYSLIHDDLPAMDDDDLRRGKPTCHKAFDEATAILAGDALQSRAFELLTELSCCAQTTVNLIQTLATASGPRGMVGGQSMDLAGENTTISIEQLEATHRLKTGALIRASVVMGASYAGANPVQLRTLDEYAQHIGLAFQVQDDILDIEGNTQTLGKPQGADLAHNKSTYPALLGMAGAKEKAQQLHTAAMAALTDFGEEAQPLRDLSNYIISRTF